TQENSDCSHAPPGGSAYLELRVGRGRHTAPWLQEERRRHARFCSFAADKAGHYTRELQRLSRVSLLSRCGCILVCFRFGSRHTDQELQPPPLLFRWRKCCQVN